MKIFTTRRQFFLGTAAAIEFLTNSSELKSAEQPSIELSGAEADDNLVAGHPVGALTVRNSANLDWSFSLAEDGSGAFSIVGHQLCVGSRRLDHGAAPSPRITVQAKAGTRRISKSFVIEVRRALPSLPLPVGARIACHGDSQQAFNNGQTNIMSSTQKSAADNFAYGTLTQALSVDPRFNCDNWYDPADPYGRFIQGANQGIFGDHMEWQRPELGNGILPRLDYTLSKKPDIVIFSGGTNSLSSGDNIKRNTPVNADYVIAKLDEGLRKIRKAGIPVILATLMPRGGGQSDWSAADPRIRQLDLVNAWIRNQYESGRNGIIGLFDPWDVLAPQGLPIPEYMDPPRVHPNAKGAYLAAVTSRKSLLTAIQANVSAGCVFEQDPALNNMLGEAVGRMGGKDGRKIARATTGAVASEFSLRMVRGSSSQLGAKEKVEGAIERQIITITAAADNLPYHWSDFSISDPEIQNLPTEGQWCRAYLHVEIGDTTDVGGVTLTVSLIGNGVVVLAASGMQVNSSTFVQPSVGNRSFWVQTEPFRIPSEVAGVLYNARIAFSSAASKPITVKYSRAILRSVDDPRKAWGY